MKSLMPLVFFGCLLTACGGGGGGSPVFSSSGASQSSGIQHVVIIIQENRSFDDLFNGYPGADTVQSGRMSTGQTVPLQPIGLEYPRDINHSHVNWEVEYGNGTLSFDKGTPTGEPPTFPYAYVPQAETMPYWNLARNYTLADRNFQSNTGPSFVAHLYLTAGGAEFARGQYVAENPAQNNVGLPVATAWGCDDPPGTAVALLGPNGTDILPGVFPCFTYKTLADEMDARGISWRYYAPAIGTSGGSWSAFDAFHQIRNGPDWATKVVSPETNVLTDAPAGNVASVTWVVPTGRNSDHGGSRSASGPDWVAAVVNAIGQSPEWNSTAIFITWDDWGGWYDHVVPPQIDAMGLGFRVPLLVVSPYAKHGYVSHVQHEFGSILRFTEERFGLAPLQASDARADDLSDCFDFSQSPAPFTPLQTARRPGSFTHAPEATPPDND